MPSPILIDSDSQWCLTCFLFCSFCFRLFCSAVTFANLRSVADVTTILFFRPDRGVDYFVNISFKKSRWKQNASGKVLCALQILWPPPIVGILLKFEKGSPINSSLTFQLLWKKKKKNFSLGDENSVGKKKRSGRRWFQPLMVRKIKIKQNLCKTRRLWRVVGMNALHSLQNAFASIPFVRIVVMSIAAAPRAFMWFNCIYCYFIFTTSKFGKTAPKHVSRKHISFRVCLQFRRSKGGRFKKGGKRKRLIKKIFFFQI